MNKLVRKYIILVKSFCLYNKKKYLKYFCRKFNINKNEIIKILNQSKEDFLFYFESDPSIKLKEEVFILNGYKAICLYRLGNLLYNREEVLMSRQLSEYIHSLYGIDIHPQVFIDSPFFIDHGTGIVIGSTAIIGKFVKMYHGVTLGAKYITNKEKRHPTIEDNVTLFAHSAVFGDITIKENTIVKAYELFVE